MYRIPHSHKFSTFLASLLMMALLTSCVDDKDESGDATIVKVGDVVPTFSLTSSNGEDLPSSSLTGRVYILHFFDTSCPDCRMELEVLQRIYEKYSDALPILNVPRSQTKPQIQTYWTEAGLSMPFYIPHDTNLYYQFATRTIPRTYIVDSTGKVHAAFSDSPVADFETIDTNLQQLLGEATPK